MISRAWNAVLIATVMALVIIAGAVMAQSACVYSIGTSSPWYELNNTNPNAPNGIYVTIQPYTGNSACANASAVVYYELINNATGQVVVNASYTASWVNYASQGYWLPFNNPGPGVYYAYVWVPSTEASGGSTLSLNFTCLGVSCPSPEYLFVSNIKAITANVTPSTITTKPGAAYTITACFSFNGTFAGPLTIQNFLNNTQTFNANFTVSPSSSACFSLNLTAPTTPGTYVGMVYTPDPASATYTLIVESSTSTTSPTTQVVAPVGISVNPVNNTVGVGQSFTEYVTLILNGTASSNVVYYVNVTFNGQTTQLPITIMAGQSSGTNYVILKAPDKVGVFTGTASYESLSASFYVTTVNVTAPPAPTALWVVPVNQSVPMYSLFEVTVYMNVSAPAPASITYNVTIKFGGYPPFTVPVLVPEGSTTSQGTVVYMYAPGAPGVYQGIASYGSLSADFYVTVENVTGLGVNFTVYPKTVYVQPNQRFSVNVTATLTKPVNYQAGFLLIASLAGYNMTTWFTVPPNSTSAVMTVPFTAPGTPGIYTAYIYVGGNEYAVTVYDGIYPFNWSLLTNPLFILLILLAVFIIAVLVGRRRRKRERWIDI